MAAYTPSMNLSNNTPITKGMVLHQDVRPGIVSSADGVCKVYKESSENETRDGLHLRTRLVIVSFAAG